MKPVYERNQECLPPKKRELPASNDTSTTTTITTNNNNNNSSSSSGAVGVIASSGGEEAQSSQSSGGSGESQSGGGVDWMRAQPSLHYGVEGAEGFVSVPMDQYSMLYKVALPAGTYSPTNLHHVLGHISPAYTVPSQVLQHTNVPYPPLGYTQIPHSSLQFVSSPYATAVPYALPPGFVPSSLMPPQSAIPQPHSVSHLVPYQSVIQEDVVTSPSTQQGSAHVYTKLSAPSAVPLVLPSEAQLGTVGLLSSGEISQRGVPVLYHPTVRSIQTQQEKEVNGGDREHGSRLLQTSTQEPLQDKTLRSQRLEGCMSPGQSSTPDTDLEVQQVVGQQASSCHGTSRKEPAHVPLNLSQGSQRVREAQGDVRTGFPLNPSESRAHQQHIVQQGHTVVLANGQPVVVPMDYRQQNFQPNNVASTAIVTSLATYPKPIDSAGCLQEQAVSELTRSQDQKSSQQQPAPSVPHNPSAPSHFMKGAIIQLATGELKRVEDLQTQDFVRSAEISGGLKIDSSMVVDIRPSQRSGLVALHFNVGEQQSKVTIDVPPEHPFFVFGQGWSSCSPERTAQLYGLTCHHLQVGDVCVSVTLQQQAGTQPKHSQQQQVQARAPAKANSTSGGSLQSMGPPAPQHTRPQTQLKLERIHRERDKEETLQQVGTSRHGDVSPRANRTVEYTQSQSNYFLHNEGHPPSSSLGASQRRWSAPGFQRYSIKNEEGNLALATTSGSSRPSFIPQEVKVSIEGRSNAGK